MIPFGAGIMLFFARMFSRNRDPDEYHDERVLDDELDRADLFALQGDGAECAAIAKAVLAHLDSLAPGSSPRRRCRAHLLLAECAGDDERPAAAIAHLDAAESARSRLPEDAGSRVFHEWRRLQLLIGPAGGRSEDPGKSPTELLALPDLPLSRGSAASWTIRVARFAQLGARAEMRAGSWTRARAMLEHSVRLGERVRSAGDFDDDPEGFERDQLRWNLARVCASTAARELGVVLVSLGQMEEAGRWFDRAVNTLAGAELAIGRIARVRALIVRAMNAPGDPLLGFEARARGLAEARDLAARYDWPAARGLAAGAEIQLGVLKTQEGASEAAIALFRSAHQRVKGVTVPGAAEPATEALMLLGHVLEDRGELEEARAEYRRAFDTGRGDADPDARRMAAVAGCHLHRLLHHGDRPDEARELLEPLESLAPTLPAPALALVAAMVARCRGHQHFRDGDRAAAANVFDSAARLAESVAGSEAVDLSRQIAAERGNLALASGKPAEAEAHFRRALATPSGSRPAPVEAAERAEIQLRLVQALLNQGRQVEAIPELERIFERGRDSGRANGRSAAAAAALLLGDHPELPIEARRSWYERAASFGRLSASPRGLEVAEAVARRLRELTGES